MITQQQQSYKRIPAADCKGQTALVVELCKKHLSQFPDDGLAWVWYAMAKTRLHRFDDAEKAIRRAISLCKGQKRMLGIAFLEMGNLFEAKGDFKAAAAWYRRALGANPSRDYYIYLGVVASKRGLMKQAESNYRRALKQPDCCVEEAYFNLGGVLVAKRRYREAINCYRKAIEIDPKYGLAKKRLMDAKLALRLKNS